MILYGEFFGGRRETDSWLANTYTGEVGPVSFSTQPAKMSETQLSLRYGLPQI